MVPGVLSKCRKASDEWEVFSCWTKKTVKRKEEKKERKEESKKASFGVLFSSSYFSFDKDLRCFFGVEWKLNAAVAAECQLQRMSFFLFLFISSVLFLLPRQDENRIESSKQSTEAG